MDRGKKSAGFGQARHLTARFKPVWQNFLKKKVLLLISTSLLPWEF